MRICRSAGATSTSTPLSSAALSICHSLKTRLPYSSTLIPPSDAVVATTTSAVVSFSSVVRSDWSSARAVGVRAPAKITDLASRFRQGLRIGERDERDQRDERPRHERGGRGASHTGGFLTGVAFPLNGQIFGVQ